MPSAQDCAERLREQAYRTLLPQIRDLEQELQNIRAALSTGVHQIGQKLEALSHIELPTTELVLNEILGDVTRETDLRSSALVLFAHTLRGKETQEEILSLLLDSAHKYFPRTAILAVRGNRFVGWSSRGYPDDLARTIGSCSFPRSEGPQLEQALDGSGPLSASDFSGCAPLEFLNGKSQGVYCLIPLRVLERPVALLMAEGAEQSQNDRDALCLLVEFAALQLENIALKILYELTSSKPDTGSLAQEEPAVQSAPSEQPDSAPAPVTPEIPVTAAQAEPVPPLASTFDLEAFQKPAPATEPGLTEAAQASLASPGDRAESEAPIPEPEPPKIVQETRQVPEEEKLHSEAKRFARLLVSEIKLYNEHHVADGRENRDLYLRLKRDIDRSREMYEKRVSPHVSKKIDYFHDEIIRILGDNDPSTLGSDYPGPRAES